jgi:MYND finger
MAATRPATTSHWEAELRRVMQDTAALLSVKHKENPSGDVYKKEVADAFLSAWKPDMLSSCRLADGMGCRKIRKFMALAADLQQHLSDVLTMLGLFLRTAEAMREVPLDGSRGDTYVFTHAELDLAWRHHDVVHLMVDMTGVINYLSALAGHFDLQEKCDETLSMIGDTRAIYWTSIWYATPAKYKSREAYLLSTEARFYAEALVNVCLKRKLLTNCKVLEKLIKSTYCLTDGACGMLSFLGSIELEVLESANGDEADHDGDDAVECTVEFTMGRTVELTGTDSPLCERPKVKSAEDSSVEHTVVPRPAKVKTILVDCGEHLPPKEAADEGHDARLKAMWLAAADIIIKGDGMSGRSGSNDAYGSGDSRNESKRLPTALVVSVWRVVADLGLTDAARRMATYVSRRVCAGCFRRCRKLKRCGGCQVTSYCSRECQAEHWKQGGHKAVCSTLCSVDEDCRAADAIDPPHLSRPTAKTIRMRDAIKPVPERNPASHAAFSSDDDGDDHDDHDDHKDGRNHHLGMTHAHVMEAMQRLLTHLA